MSQEVEQANVLYFNQAERSSTRKWGFDIQENWIEENTNQSAENNEENDEVSLGLHLLERWSKKRQELEKRPGDRNSLPALNAIELVLLRNVGKYLEELREKLKNETSGSQQRAPQRAPQQAQPQDQQQDQPQNEPQDQAQNQSEDQPQDRQQPAEENSQIPTSTEGFFEYLEPSKLNIERGISRRPKTFMAREFKYIGRLYVSECYIHRYFNIITSQGWLTESEKQVFGDIYHVGNSDNLSPVVSRDSMA